MSTRAVYAIGAVQWDAGGDQGSMVISQGGQSSTVELMADVKGTTEMPSRTAQVSLPLRAMVVGERKHLLYTLCW